jgi:hypothetical protein
MSQYGNYKVLSQHSHGGNALRVKVMHVPTGRIEYRVITLP